MAVLPQGLAGWISREASSIEVRIFNRNGRRSRAGAQRGGKPIPKYNGHSAAEQRTLKSWSLAKKNTAMERNCFRGAECLHQTSVMTRFKCLPGRMINISRGIDGAPRCIGIGS